MRGAADSGKFRQLSRQIAAIGGFCGKFAAGFVFDEVQKRDGGWGELSCWCWVKDRAEAGSRRVRDSVVMGVWLVV